MKTNVNILNREQKYTAPAITEINLFSEGLLCASPDLYVEDWVREQNQLEF